MKFSLKNLTITYNVKRCLGKFFCIFWISPNLVKYIYRWLPQHHKIENKIKYGFWKGFTPNNKLFIITFVKHIRSYDIGYLWVEIWVLHGYSQRWQSWKGDSLDIDHSTNTTLIQCFAALIQCFAAPLIQCFAALIQCFASLIQCFAALIQCFAALIQCFPALIQCFAALIQCFAALIQCFPALIQFSL